jgi:ATP-dependent exoDNAse (exonuclease V) alpha subunit
VAEVSEQFIGVQFYKQNSTELHPTVQIGRESWAVQNAQKKDIASRNQFPLILSYAMTIHKSQGQTLPLVKVLSPNPD